jgi:hypothetical protein
MTRVGSQRHRKKNRLGRRHDIVVSRVMGLCVGQLKRHGSVPGMIRDFFLLFSEVC